MSWTDRFDTHFALVTRMARTLGVDLSEEVVEGRMRPEDLRAAVLSCTGCREAGACAEWLERNEGGADAAPPYCRNRERLQRLAEA